MKHVNSPEKVSLIMAVEAQARRDKYEYFVCASLPNFRTVSPGSYLGVFTISDPVEHKRYIKETAVRDIGFGLQSVTDIGRDWVKAKYGKLRTTGESLRACLLDRPFPIYVLPVALDCGHYLDLRSAYWSIVQTVGLDCDYNPDKWLFMGNDVSDFPLPDDKIARSSIVSSGHSSTLRIWTGKNIKMIEKNGRNNILYALVMDILNGIAGDMKDAGAVYCYSDGYIVPDKMLPVAIEILNSWGFNYSVKATGDTWITGVNQYKCGSKMTRIFDPYRHAEGHDKITEYVNRDWLRSHYMNAVRIRVLRSRKAYAERFNVISSL